MPETLLREPPPDTTHTAPPELERVLAMRRDELKPTVRTYADNLHAQILAIFAEHGAKNYADFEQIAREKELPLSLLEDIQHRMNQLLHIIETQELPSTFVVSNAKNPYHEALTAGGLTDPTQNPERMDRTIDLQKLKETSTALFEDHTLREWAESTVSADLSLLTPDKRAQIDTLVKDGWDVIALMPGKHQQLQNLKTALETLKPLWIKENVTQTLNATVVWDHLTTLIDQKAEELTKDVPLRPYLLLTSPTQKPPAWTTNQTLDQQKTALTDHQRRHPDVHAMNPAEYVVTQARYTRCLQTTATDTGHALTVLDPLDTTTWTRLIDLPLSSDGVVPGVGWRQGDRQLLFGGNDPGDRFAEVGFRLSVRVEV